MISSHLQSPDAETSADKPSSDSAHWRDTYGPRHRLERVQTFPAGVSPPKKVRLYARRDHYIAQWWDPAAKKNLSERINGDLIDAIARARDIDGRLEHFRTSGQGMRKLKHGELVDAFVADLQRRADAGELTVATAKRYVTALEHYRAFVGEPARQKAFPFAAGASRDFQLAFAAYLEHLQVAPNGHQHARRRPLRSPQIVRDTVRAMYAWGADPARGNLLPAGFRNPFCESGRSRRSPAPDIFGQPDITTAMAVDLLKSCDAFQLPLFGTLALFGLRAAEPIYLFQDEIEGDWLKVACLPALGYPTKGKRDKRFPIPGCLRNAWGIEGAPKQGLLFTRRTARAGCRDAPWHGASLAELGDEFQRRCRQGSESSATARQSIRDQLIRDADGLNYDQIEQEFQRLARQLGWPQRATPKDLRHLFSTSLENSGVPEFYRRYLMGQSPGKAPIVTYTHLNQLQTQFQKALDQDLAPLVAAIDQRACELAC